jgi:tetratricopeptide (TPR) repeat protein
MSRSEGAIAALKAQTKIKNHAEEMGAYLKDMQAWEKKIKLKNKGLKAKPRKVPPVRASGGLIPVGATATLPSSSTVKTNKKNKSTHGSAAGHTYDKGYKRWEKFDVDAALNDVDAKEQKQEDDDDEEEIVPIQTPATMVVHSKKATPQIGVSVAQPKPALKTPSEREADERQKGNDFFQKGDFHKAIKAYTACLGISNRSVLAFSNRAMCWLKLKEWRKAEMDATLALQVDSAHVKSYQRRASARNALGMHRAALGDLTEALECHVSSNNSDQANTFIKALNIDIRKTKELLRSAMRNAPRTRVKIMVDYAPTLPPAPSSSSSTTTPTSVPVEEVNEVDEEERNDNKDSAEAEPQVEANSTVTPSHQLKDDKKQDDDDESVMKSKSTTDQKVRTSSTIKITYSNDGDDKDDDENSDEEDDDDDEVCKKSNKLTPGNLMNFKYDPSTQDNDVNEEESSAMPLPSSSSSLSSSSSSSSSSMTSSKTESKSSSSSSKTLKVPKDPKGPFEMERLWRSCGNDEKMKLKLSKKWLKSDGKLMSKIFGSNKNNLGNSCPLDSDILCDILIYRIQPFLTTNKKKNKNNREELYHDMLSSIKILFIQPKFISSIDFFTCSNITLLDETLKSCEDTHLVQLINNIIHP